MILEISHYYLLHFNLFLKYFFITKCSYVDSYYLLSIFKKLYKFVVLNLIFLLREKLNSYPSNAWIYLNTRQFGLKFDVGL